MARKRRATAQRYASTMKAKRPKATVRNPLNSESHPEVKTRDDYKENHSQSNTQNTQILPLALPSLTKPSSIASNSSSDSTLNLSSPHANTINQQTNERNVKPKPTTQQKHKQQAQSFPKEKVDNLPASQPLIASNETDTTGSVKLPTSQLLENGNKSTRLNQSTCLTFHDLPSCERLYPQSSSTHPTTTDHDHLQSKNNISDINNNNMKSNYNVENNQSREGTNDQMSQQPSTKRMKVRNTSGDNEIAPDDCRNDECLKSKVLPNANPFNTKNSPFPESNEEAPSMILFMCASCCSPLSDTTLGYQFNIDCTNVSLKACNNVSISEDLDMVKQGAEKGCVYNGVSCTRCKSELGKIYSFTSPELDHLRNHYIFDTSKISTYKLGRGKSTSGVEIISHQPPKKSSPSQEHHPFEPEKPDEQQQYQNVEQNNTNVSNGTDKNECNSMAVVVNDNMQESPSMALFQDLEMHVETVTNAVNNLTDVIKQTRSDVRELRKACNELYIRAEDGENALGHVHKLMLLWDEKIKDINGVKESLNKILPFTTTNAHRPDQHHMVIEEPMSVAKPHVVRQIAAAQSSSPKSGIKHISRNDIGTNTP